MYLLTEGVPPLGNVPRVEPTSRVAESVVVLLDPAGIKRSGTERGHFPFIIGTPVLLAEDDEELLLGVILP